MKIILYNIGSSSNSYLPLHEAEIRKYVVKFIYKQYLEITITYQAMLSE